MRGYRVFTACRTVNGKVFRLEDHLDRLYHSAANIYMQPPMPRNELRELMEKLVAINRVVCGDRDLLIDIIFSGGLEDNSMKSTGRGAFLYVAVQELIEPPPEVYETGVALATYRHLRLWPDVKLLNYVGATIAHQTVVPQQDAYDILYVDPADGNTVLEGSTFTVFFIERDGTIVTPPLDRRILDSITRRVVLELVGKSDDLRLNEGAVLLDRLSSYTEAFIASTTRAILPLTRVDRAVIGNGLPGPITRKVMAAFREYLASY
ncbi:MAG: aminotransferase class IV [Desulfomonile sp.]|nr:aminotransferase class IV [Desulfomonile sp.]